MTIPAWFPCESLPCEISPGVRIETVAEHGTAFILSGVIKTMNVQKVLLSEVARLAREETPSEIYVTPTIALEASERPDGDRWKFSVVFDAPGIAGARHRGVMQFRAVAGIREGASHAYVEDKEHLLYGDSAIVKPIIDRFVDQAAEKIVTEAAKGAQRALDRQAGIVAGKIQERSGGIVRGQFHDVVFRSGRSPFKLLVWINVT